MGRASTLESHVPSPMTLFYVVPVADVNAQLCLELSVVRLRLD